VILAGGAQRSGAQPSATSTSQAALDEAKRLEQEVDKLGSEGKFQKATPSARRSLSLRENVLGPMHPDVATSLNYLAELYRAQGAYTKAEPLYLRALAIREKILGAGHPDVATSLNNLAELYRAQGVYAKAEPLYIRALGIREKALGPMHPDLATSLNGLADLYLDQGANAKAEPLYVRALGIREKALGPTHPDLAVTVNSLGLLYEHQGAYDKAESLLSRARDIFEKTLGSTHPVFATSLDNLAGLYHAQGAYGKAEPLYKQAFEIRKQAFGAGHPDVATSLINLAEFYRTQGAYEKGEPLYKQAIDIIKKTRGPQHPDVATIFANLAALYEAKGVYGKAEPLLVQALDIREKALGAMHPDVATTLNNLAEFYRAQGIYAKAEPLYARAFDILEKTLGTAHPDLATILNNLGGLYQDQGAYEKAEPLYVRALDIRRKALGPMHPHVARSLNNLATFYQEHGAYGKAETLLVQALDIEKQALGATHVDVGTMLDNLADLYQLQGAYGKAEQRYVEALQIREIGLGPMHPAVATNLNNLATLYWDQRAYEKIEPLLLRAIDIWQKAKEPMHPKMVTSLHNLAALYSHQRAYAKAEPLYVRALQIREKVLGPTHPDVAATVSSLAQFYYDQGVYDKAEPLYVRALHIRENVGPTHPNVAASLNKLAALYQAQGAYERALPLRSRAAEVREQQLRVELARLAEPRKRALMALLRDETDGLVSLHADAMPGSKPALELALTTVVRRKGRILDSLVDNETTLRTHLTPPLRDQLNQLTRARTELAARQYAVRGPQSATTRTAIDALRVRIEDLESTLSAASAEFRTQSEPVTVAKIQAVLPWGAALVEFVRYRYFDPRQPESPQEDRYIAYLLTSQGPPQWVVLGAAAPIDSEVDAVLAAMNRHVATESAKAVLQRLDVLMFAPICARLAGVSHIILAPDGKLNLVPFEALVDHQGHYALEKYIVSYVTTGRDLLRPSMQRRARSSAVIVAGPDYGPPPSAGVPGTVSFEPLKDAAAEATDLQQYFPTPALTGGKATKSALATLRGPAMLHIATHGFFARDPSLSVHAAAGTIAASAPGVPPPLADSVLLAPRDLSRGMFVVDSASPPRSDDLADALDRAGLALAGANQGADGIVTAREIAGFDWWGTQLVVLSACETGVGAVPSGDGVYGLRRALVLAGAASQVVSLWSVNDASTRALMRDYYGELARGAGRAEALRQAKLRLLRQPRYAHPYYWAAFIPAGDWRSLDKNVFSPRNPQP